MPPPESKPTRNGWLLAGTSPPWPASQITHERSQNACHWAVVRASAAVASADFAAAAAANANQASAVGVWALGLATRKAKDFAGAVVVRVRASVALKPAPVIQPPNVRWRSGSSIACRIGSRDCTLMVDSNAGDSSLR